MSRLKRQLSRLSGSAPPMPPASRAAPGPVSVPMPVSAPAAAPVPSAAGRAADGTDDATLRAARLEALRTRLSAYRGRRAPPRAPEVRADVALPGACEATAMGDMHVLRMAFAAEHAHGVAPVAHSLRATGPHLAALALDDALTAVDSATLLYLDTETTGLAGGAGTLPFLIGMGGFVQGCWHLEQLFLRRPGEEAPMLHHLAARMRTASAVVTYNGKSFDWPLLRTRFVLNRIPLPPPLPHLDLLHCARRLLPHLAGKTRLTHVERALLSFERVGDVDGALIPQLYFDFLRGGPVGPMAQVMTHNQHDLTALAAMLGAFATRLAMPPVATVSACECLAMARLHERRGDAAQAEAWALRAASDVPGDTIAAGEAHALRGRLHAKAGRWEPAADAWQQAAADLAGHAVRHAEVRLALAKLYEHRLKNTLGALAHAPHTAAAEGAPATAHRVARLQRKLLQSAT